MTQLQKRQKPDKVVQFKAKDDENITLPLSFPEIKSIKRRQQAMQTSRLDQIFASRSYLAIIETVMAIIDQEADTMKALSDILPYALAVSEVEVGALLVSNENINAHPGTTKLTLVAKQELPDEIVEELTTGELGTQLLVGRQLWIEPKSLATDNERALLGQSKLQYIFGLPLKFDENILGAVIVGTRNKESLLRQELRRRLAMLAQILTLFLDNKRLRNKGQDPVQEAASQPDSTTQQIDELEQLLAAVMSAEEEVVSQNTDLGMLNALSNEVGKTLQLNVILQTAIKQTRTTLNAEVGWCYLFNEGALTLCEHQGLSKQYVDNMQHLAPHDGVEGMAFSRKEPILRDGMLFLSGKARKVMQEEGLRTIAAAPLIAGKETFGVLAVSNRHDKQWSSRDRRMLMSIGRQVGQAIANSQQFYEAQQKVQNWESSYSALQEANKQLTSRAAVLENQIQELRQAEQQIWMALAASSRSRHRSSGKGLDTQADKQLLAVIKKVLGKLGNGES